MGFEVLGGVLSAAAYNRNLAALERQFAYNTGRGVLTGLTLAAGAGLTLEIAAGAWSSGSKSVNCDAFECEMDDDATRFVWINEGAYNTSLGFYEPVVTLTATSADPGGGLVCLGKVTSASGSIADIDVSGSTGGRMSVFRWTGARAGRLAEGLLTWDLSNSRIGINRTSPGYSLDVSGQAGIDQIVARASSGTPTPVASAGIVYTRLVGSFVELFYEDAGGNVSQLTVQGQAPSSPLKFTLGFAAFSSTASVATVSLGLSLPAGGVVRLVKQKHSAAFSGGSVASCTSEVGVTGTLNKYASAFNVFAAAGDTAYQLASTPGGESHTASTDLKVTLRTTGDTTDALTAGSLDVWVDYMVMA